MKWKDTQIQNKHFNRSVYLQTKEQMFCVYLLLDFGLAEVTLFFIMVGCNAIIFLLPVWVL